MFKAFIFITNLVLLTWNSSPQQRTKLPGLLDKYFYLLCFISLMFFVRYRDNHNACVNFKFNDKVCFYINLIVNFIVPIIIFLLPIRTFIILRWRV